jgi:hypothetical protein
MKRRRAQRKLTSRSDYAVSTQVRKATPPGKSIQPLVGSGNADAVALRELEDLKLRVRTLTVTNINLRRRIKSLESKQVAATAGVAPAKSTASAVKPPN